MTELPTPWTPGYLPSNSTDGDIFRCLWCDHSQFEHTPHVDPDKAVAGEPGVCEILTASYIAYPGPGPDEWESRQNTDGLLERRCTAFEDCQTCADERDRERLRVWPVTTGEAWKPRRVPHVEGQIPMDISAAHAMPPDE